MYLDLLPFLNVSFITLYYLLYYVFELICYIMFCVHIFRVDNVRGGSDQAPFIFMLGIPVIWPQYVHDVSRTIANIKHVSVYFCNGFGIIHNI